MVNAPDRGFVLIAPEVVWPNLQCCVEELREGRRLETRLNLTDRVPLGYRHSGLKLHIIIIYHYCWHNIVWTVDGGEGADRWTNAHVFIMYCVRIHGGVNSYERADMFTLCVWFGDKRAVISRCTRHAFAFQYCWCGGGR